MTPNGNIICSFNTHGSMVPYYYLEFSLGEYWTLVMHNKDGRFQIEGASIQLALSITPPPFLWGTLVSSWIWSLLNLAKLMLFRMIKPKLCKVCNNNHRVEHTLVYNG